jgi:hypothetical protein
VRPELSNKIPKVGAAGIAICSIYIKIVEEDSV